MLIDAYFLQGCRKGGKERFLGSKCIHGGEGESRKSLEVNWILNLALTLALLPNSLTLIDPKETKEDDEEDKGGGKRRLGTEY